jgi:hypothetical protein
MFNAMMNLLLQIFQLMRQRPQAHRVKQEPALTASSTRSARTGIAIPTRATASRDATGMASSSLQRNLLLLPQNLDFRRSEA